MKRDPRAVSGGECPHCRFSSRFPDGSCRVCFEVDRVRREEEHAQLEIARDAELEPFLAATITRHTLAEWVAHKLAEFGCSTLGDLAQSTPEQLRTLTAYARGVGFGSTTLANIQRLRQRVIGWLLSGRKAVHVQELRRITSQL